MSGSAVDRSNMVKALLSSVAMVVFIWSIAIVCSLYWNKSNEKENTLRLIQNEARAHFNKDQAFRFWATSHGGVYVPASERTPPNQHLAHIPERDIETPSGKKLTLMNPAYMIRQLMDEYAGLYNVRGRIVSLKPLREENAPDPWEREALLAFEKGKTEAFEISDLAGQPYLRLMRPMITDEGCLKCHEAQGYKVGDIRGGVGVSIPMMSYLKNERAVIIRLYKTHGLIWLLGIAGILASGVRGEYARLKQVETYTELQKSEQKYSDLYNKAPDMYVSVDAKTSHIKQCNQTVADALGYSKGELIDQPIFILYHADSLEDAQHAFHEFLTTGVVRDAELQLMRKDGSKIDVSLNVSAVRDEDGNILYSRSIWRDITERKHVEAELARVRHYLNNIIDSMPSMLIGVNNEGFVTHWNRKAEQTMGVSVAHAKGKQLKGVLPQFSTEVEDMRKAIRNQLSQDFESITRRVRHGDRYADVMVYPLVENGESGAVIRVDDITDQVRMEQLMLQTEKMMSVGGLAAGMAHELNNPLGGILQGLQNIRRRMSPQLEKNREVAEALHLDLDVLQTYMQRREILSFMDGVNEAGQRAAAIVKNMLNFSRKADSQPSSVDLEGLIEQALALASVDYDLKKKYDFRAIKISREFGEGLLPVPCIPSEIQQVLLNLLRNAAQALYAKQDKSTTPRITIRLQQYDGHAFIEVEDNGPGLDEETCKRIFEPFFTTRPIGEGTGLGLSVSYFIIHDEHGGKISVTSKPGKGAKFRISLPLSLRK